MGETSIGYQLEGPVAILDFDDGKANTFSPPSIAALHEAFDRAEEEARSILWTGRPGRFSAGFDLSFMKQGGRAMIDLVASGATLALRVYQSPVPVTIGVTGHALAMGAIMLLAADNRIGVTGNFKIGLNEVAIGMVLPEFGLEFARARLSKRHVTRAVSNAEIYTPEAAVEAGYLDRVVPEDSLREVAIAHATQLASLDLDAHKATKIALRRETIARIQAAIDAFPR